MNYISELESKKFFLKLFFVDPFLTTNCYSLIERLIILSINNSFIDTNTSLKNVIINHLIKCLDCVNEEFYESNIQIWHYYPTTEGEFYYLIKILAHYRLAKTRTKEKGISSKEASH